MTEQVFYKSKDGTRVPMFITHRRDMKKDGNQPVLLYGYGGFNISATPMFRAPMLAWLEMGGVFAEANLRGGGEYGEAWHHGRHAQQEAERVRRFHRRGGVSDPRGLHAARTLAIHGRSNGGLLVGAALMQRPDLFGAALPAVGVLDMLRYHTASANARQWSSDYGLSENADDFKAQFAYSPVHNVKPGTCYPPTLVTTADHDDRVVPWHSFKFAAALQARAGLRQPGPDPRRNARRPRRRQARVDADRGLRRSVGLRAKALQMPVPATSSARRTEAVRNAFGWRRRAAGARIRRRAAVGRQGSGIARFSDSHAPRSISLQRSLQNGRNGAALPTTRSPARRWDT